MPDHVLTVRSEPSGLTIVISGEFGPAAAQALLRTAAIAASSGVGRIDVDLQAVTAASDEAVHAVTSCRRLSAQVAHGIGFRVAGVGRQLLLASLAQDRHRSAAAAATA